MSYEQKSKYLLSVIVPVYNAEKYLKECLDSIINQTLKGIQIIIVNDGSTDGSLNIIKEFQNRHKNITVVNQHNKGVTSARLKGLSIATGEYVAWVDNDDILESEMYEKMHNSALKDNSDVVICNYNLHPKPVPNKAIWFNEYNGMVDWKFINRNTVIWNKLFKYEYLLRINYSELLNQMGEASFALTLLNTNKITTLSDKLYNYRVGHGSLSAYKNLNWYLQGIETATKRVNYINRSEQHIYAWGEYFEHLMFMSYISALIVSARLGLSGEYHKLRKELLNKQIINNPYNKTVISINFGFIKYLYFRYIVLSSYAVTKYSSRLWL